MTSFVESPVVRKNLERAFRKSVDKLDWFLSLRNHGISQEFYEYILSEMRLPLSVIIEDLRALRIQPTSRIREAIIQDLTTLVPTYSMADRPLIEHALRYLTPLEKQDAIVSRFVLAEPDAFLLTDEILELLWEKRTQVGEEVLEKWLEKILTTVAARPKNPIVMRWIYLGWEENHKWRKLYSPQSLDLSLEDLHFYLNTLLESHKDEPKDSDLILEQALLVRDDIWISRLLLNSAWYPQDPRVVEAISHIRDAYLKAKVGVERAVRALDRAIEIENLKIIFEESPLESEKSLAAHRVLELWIQRLAVADEKDLRAMEAYCEKLDGSVYERAIELRTIWGDRSGVWAQLTNWWKSQPSMRPELLDRLLSAATEAQTIEELQRLLVDYVLVGVESGEQREFILDLLLEDSSPYRLKYLRQEFIDSALKVHPLHRLLLKKRSTYDFRATLLLKIFYGEKGTSQEPPAVAKRKHSFWGMVGEKSGLSVLPQASKIFVTTAQTCEGHAIRELEKFAERLAQAFEFKLKNKERLQVQSVSGLDFAFRLRLPERCLDLAVGRNLHGNLELMRFVICGALQVLHDYDEGLFDSISLADRFLRGGLLSGIPIATALRFVIDLEAELRGFTQEIVRGWAVSDLLRELPTVREFLILFLSRDYEDRVAQSGILLN